MPQAWGRHGQLLVRASPQGDGAGQHRPVLAEALPPGGRDEKSHPGAAGESEPLLPHPRPPSPGGQRGQGGQTGGSAGRRGYDSDNDRQYAWREMGAPRLQPLPPSMCATAAHPHPTALRPATPSIPELHLYRAWRPEKALTRPLPLEMRSASTWRRPVWSFTKERS